MAPNLLQRGRVLVVDDDAGCARALAAMLRADGFEVDTASHASEALESMRKSPPDALVTDLNMPDIDGFELLKQVRCELPDTLVVVVSGSGLRRVAPMLEEGALAYVAKPADADHVVSVLDAGLQMRDERRRALSERPPAADEGPPSGES